MGYFCKLFAGKQDTTPNIAVEGLLLVISIQKFVLLFEFLALQPIVVVFSQPGSRL